MPEFLEHRWGSRIPLELNVELRTQDGAGASGRILNVSLSGAYIQSALRVAALSRLRIRLLSQATQWLEAFVVRRDHDGFAVEWVERESREMFRLVVAASQVPPLKAAPAGFARPMRGDEEPRSPMAAAGPG